MSGKNPWPPRELLWWPIPWAIVGFMLGIAVAAVVIVAGVRWVVG